MVRKAHYYTRTHYRARSKKRLLSKKILPTQTKYIPSLVKEVQDAVCYIDFTRNHFYSNEQLNEIFPWMKNERFTHLHDLVQFFVNGFEEQGIDHSQIQSILKEVLTHRLDDSKKVSPKTVTVGSQIFQLFFNYTKTPRGIFIMWVDHTETLHSDNQRDSFLAELSHEFRTPLTTVKGYSELLLTKVNCEDKAYDMVKRMKIETERLERLVDNFLYFHKDTYSRNQLHLSLFSLEKLLEDVVNSYRESSSQHTFFRSCLKANIVADYEKLLQLLHNLIGNAVKYSPRGGDIEISFMKQSELFVLSIKDSGVGIPENSLPYIFDEYYRVDSQECKNIKGTGLGLCICKKIVRAHEWEIGVDSEIGGGTTFTIFLNPNDVIVESE